MARDHKFAAHLIPTHWGQRDEEHLSRIAPKSIKIIDRFERVPLLYRLSPNSIIVYRDHPLSEQHDDMMRDPEGTGKRHAAEWAEKLARWRHPVPDEQVVVLGINEPRVWDDPDPKRFGSPYAQGVYRTVEYTVAFLDALTKLGIRGGALNLSVGWPANSGKDMPPVWEPYRPVYDSIRKGQHILFLHEYWPHQGPEMHLGWMAGRALKCPWDVPIIIGECGLEERVTSPNVPPSRWGWKGWLTPEQYMDQLWRYHDIMNDRRIHSLQIFTWDFSQPFGSLDIRDMLDLIPENSAWDNAIWDYGGTRPPGDAVPIPPDPSLAQVLVSRAQEEQVIRFNPNAALQKSIFADGYVPNSPEFEVDHRGQVYVAQRAEHMGTGDVRVYYVPKFEWDKVEYIDADV